MVIAAMSMNNSISEGGNETPIEKYCHNTRFCKKQVPFQT